MEAVLGIIPPAHMKDLFHEEACDVFQQGSKDQAEDKEDGDVIDIGLQGAENDDRSRAVYGAEGTAKKAPFHKMPFGYGAVDRFRHPAENRIDDKI